MRLAGSPEIKSGQDFKLGLTTHSETGKQGWICLWWRWPVSQKNRLTGENPLNHDKRASAGVPCRFLFGVLA